jgi:hypothetical protein
MYKSASFVFKIEVLSTTQALNLIRNFRILFSEFELATLGSKKFKLIDKELIPLWKIYMEQFAYIGWSNHMGNQALERPPRLTPMVVLTNFQPKRSNAVAPTEPSLVTRAVKSNLPFRFYNIGNRRNQVTLLENREEITKRRPACIKLVGFWLPFMSVLRRPTLILTKVCSFSWPCSCFTHSLLRYLCYTVPTGCRSHKTGRSSVWGLWILTVWGGKHRMSYSLADWALPTGTYWEMQRNQSVP